MISGLQLDVRHHIQWRRHLVNAYEVLRGKSRHGVLCRLKAVWSMPDRFRVVCTMQSAIQVLWFTFLPLTQVTTTIVDALTFWRLQLLLVVWILMSALVKPTNRMNVLRGRDRPVIIMIWPPIKMNQQLPVVLHISCNARHSDTITN